jgi:hypothetical protein
VTDADALSLAILNGEYDCATLWRQAVDGTLPPELEAALVRLASSAPGGNRAPMRAALRLVRRDSPPIDSATIPA